MGDAQFSRSELQPKPRDSKLESFCDFASCQADKASIESETFS